MKISRIHIVLIAIFCLAVLPENVQSFSEEVERVSRWRRWMPSIHRDEITWRDRSIPNPYGLTISSLRTIKHGTWDRMWEKLGYRDDSLEDPEEEEPEWLETAHQ